MMAGIRTKATGKTDAPADPLPDRMRALTDFLARFASGVGEYRDGTHRADDDNTNPAVIVARDDAMLAAFEAIERLSSQIV
jgi:hypothetical protein